MLFVPETLQALPTPHNICSEFLQLFEGLDAALQAALRLAAPMEAFSEAISAARWAAKGVLLRLPLKPATPAEAKHKASPILSVMVTMVLLNVALIWATP